MTATTEEKQIAGTILAAFIRASGDRAQIMFGETAKPGASLEDLWARILKTVSS